MKFHFHIFQMAKQTTNQFFLTDGSLVLFVFWTKLLFFQEQYSWTTAPFHWGCHATGHWTIPYFFAEAVQKVVPNLVVLLRLSVEMIWSNIFSFRLPLFVEMIWSNFFWSTESTRCRTESSTRRCSVDRWHQVPWPSSGSCRRPCRRELEATKLEKSGRVEKPNNSSNIKKKHKKTTENRVMLTFLLAEWMKMIQCDNPTVSSAKVALPPPTALPRALGPPPLLAPVMWRPESMLKQPWVQIRQ